VGVDDSRHESFRVLRNGDKGCRREHARQLGGPVSRGAQPGVPLAQARPPRLCNKPAVAAAMGERAPETMQTAPLISLAASGPRPRSSCGS
jgi:hypothetical protein